MTFEKLTEDIQIKCTSCQIDCEELKKAACKPASGGNSSAPSIEGFLDNPWNGVRWMAEAFGAYEGTKGLAKWGKSKWKKHNFPTKKEILTALGAAKKIGGRMAKSGEILPTLGYLLRTPGLVQVSLGSHITREIAKYIGPDYDELLSEEGRGTEVSSGTLMSVNPLMNKHFREMLTGHEQGTTASDFSQNSATKAKTGTRSTLVADVSNAVQSGLSNLSFTLEVGTEDEALESWIHDEARLVAKNEIGFQADRARRMGVK